MPKGLLHGSPGLPEDGGVRGRGPVRAGVEGGRVDDLETAVEGPGDVVGADVREALARGVSLQACQYLVDVSGFLIMESVHILCTKIGRLRNTFGDDGIA